MRLCPNARTARESIHATHIEKQRFALAGKENEVVTRGDYREETVRWRRTTRFVSGETFDL